MTRRERQLDELRRLCHTGRVARAIDLAFEHFADFGRDDGVVDLLTDAIDHAQPVGPVRHRLAELRASRPRSRCEP